MARAPDIIQTQSIPLSAVSDQPVDELPRPPINASAHPDDQARGVSREISSEELALTAAARKGDPATAEMSEEADGATHQPKPDTDDGKAPPKDAKTDDAVVTDPTEDDGLDIDPTKAPNWAVKEVARIRKAAREGLTASKAELARITAEAETARKELEALRAKVPAEVEQPKLEADPRPTRDQFDDPDLYDDAIMQWADREVDRKAAARVAEKEAETKRLSDEAEAATKAEADAAARVEREAELQTISDNWESAVAVAKEEKYPDWDEVVMRADTDGGPTVTPVMGAVLAQMPNGTDIAYYLAVNVDESKRIAAINNPFLQSAEIGALSKQLATPSRQARRARPIEPVQTNRTPPENPSPDDEDMDAYYARRTPQLAVTRQPFFPPGGIH